LLVVGDGPDAAAMRAEAERVGLADAVHLVGATADVGAYLDQADLLLCPSASESFGMAALEAMVAGVPVVGSRVGGLTEVVADDICGRLLPVGDLDGMAEAACQILLQPGLAAAYAEAGRRIARTRFSPDGAIAAYRGLYAATRAGRGTQPFKGAT
jgi:glycosyltransferase involved in cell wall biosynthesis